MRSEIQLHANNIVNPPRFPRSAGVYVSLGANFCCNTKLSISDIKDNKLRLYKSVTINRRLTAVALKASFAD
jgi:hypothetical protein